MTDTKFTKEELQDHGMKPNAIKAFLELQKQNIAVRIWDDNSRGHFWIWTEGVTEETTFHVDYYDNYFGSDLLQNILDENGLCFEWYNSGQCNVYDK